MQCFQFIFIKTCLTKRITISWANYLSLRTDRKLNYLIYSTLLTSHQQQWPTHDAQDSRMFTFGWSILRLVNLLTGETFVQIVNRIYTERGEQKCWTYCRQIRLPEEISKSNFGISTNRRDERRNNGEVVTPWCIYFFTN